MTATDIYGASDNHQPTREIVPRNVEVRRELFNLGEELVCLYAIPTTFYLLTTNIRTLLR